MFNVNLDKNIRVNILLLNYFQSTLRTANLSTLPDKGVRLQMLLKKHETKLRDLRYQQSTISNEILKLQSKSFSVIIVFIGVLTV